MTIVLPSTLSGLDALRADAVLNFPPGAYIFRPCYKDITLTGGFEGDGLYKTVTSTSTEGFNPGLASFDPSASNNTVSVSNYYSEDGDYFESRIVLSDQWSPADGPAFIKKIYLSELTFNSDGAAQIPEIDYDSTGAVNFEALGLDGVWWHPSGQPEGNITFGDGLLRIYKRESSVFNGNEYNRPRGWWVKCNVRRKSDLVPFRGYDGNGYYKKVAIQTSGSFWDPSDDVSTIQGEATGDWSGSGARLTAQSNTSRTWTAGSVENVSTLTYTLQDQITGDGWKEFMPRWNPFGTYPGMTDAIAAQMVAISDQITLLNQQMADAIENGQDPEEAANEYGPQIETLQAAFENLISQAQENADEIAQLNEQISTLTAEVEVLEAARFSLNAEIQTLQAQLDALGPGVDQEIIDALTAQLDAKNMEVLGMTQSIDEKNAQIQSIEAQIDARTQKGVTDEMEFFDRGEIIGWRMKRGDLEGVDGVQWIGGSLKVVVLNPDGSVTPQTISSYGVEPVVPAGWNGASTGKTFDVDGKLIVDVIGVGNEPDMEAKNLTPGSLSSDFAYNFQNVYLDL